MILLTPDFLRGIERAAEAAYPRECCGLIAGLEEKGGDIMVTRVRPSRNVATPERSDRFEIDPETRFRLMREIGEFDRLDGAAGERIVGHYHSHPDHPALPSAHDLEMAFEPDLFWLIVAVDKGRATDTAIHRLDPARQVFRQLGFKIKKD